MRASTPAMTAQLSASSSFQNDSASGDYPQTLSRMICAIVSRSGRPLHLRARQAPLPILAAESQFDVR